MAGLDFVNPALSVEAVAFAPWQGHWLGVLITPWFMNLILAPRDIAAWPMIKPGDKQCHRFPAGAYDFIAAHDGVAGDYQMCSLFSPLLHFDDQETARLVAGLAREALFDDANAEKPDSHAGNVSSHPAWRIRRARPACRNSKHGWTRRNPSATSCAPGGRPTIVVIEGELTVHLDCEGRHVRRVTVRSTRPMIAARVLTGRTAADAAATVPRLFSICSGAQGAASATALAAAGASGAAFESGNRECEVMLEALQDTFWHLLIDWPNTMGTAPCATPVATVRFQIAAAMRAADGTPRLNDAEAMRELGARLSAVAAQAVFGMPPADWLKQDDVAALQAWCDRGGTVPATLLGPRAEPTACARPQRDAAAAADASRLVAADHRPRAARRQRVRARTDMGWLGCGNRRAWRGCAASRS